MSVLMAATSSAQPPVTPATCMRCLSLPSLPTAWVTREVSRARVSLSSAMSLKASAILPFTPVSADDRRTEKSPCLNDSMAASKAWENWSSSPVGGPDGPGVHGFACAAGR